MTDADGYWTFKPLGENKHDIPTGITETETQKAWPKGDVLISPFVYKDGKLVGFCDTKSLTVPTPTDPDSTVDKFDTLMPYDYIQVEFTSLAEGDIALYAPRAKTVKVKWKDADDFEVVTQNKLGGGSFKYAKCTKATQVKAIDDYLEDIEDGTWSQKLWALTDGGELFGSSSSNNANKDIETFNSDLTSLTNGERMFNNCENLTTFNGDLSSLTNGTFMFENCRKLSTFNCGDLSSLKYGRHMFDDCKCLTSFNSDLSSLEDGYSMFYNCILLTSFNSNLGSLTDGTNLFLNCKLNTESVKIIADTIKAVTSGTINIGIGNETPNTKEEEAFNMMVSKGWKVYVNGSTKPYAPTDGTNNLDETGEERIIPIPFYAKPIPATEETADYVDENGNFFNICGAQFIYGDDLSTYGMFTCEADAAANMRLTPYIKPMEN